jgi:hypothetical protein
MNQMHPIPAERQELATHVDLCAQRYAALELRLARIERVLWALLAWISHQG